MASSVNAVLVRLAPGTVMAGVFTRSSTRSGCVRDCQAKLAMKVADGAGAAIIVNSGNSNAFKSLPFFDFFENLHEK